MKIEAGPSTQSRRNTNLDALRAIAIFLVLGAHSGYRGLWEKPWARAGWAGVDLFFVLSGFLVSGLLFIAYKERGRIDCSHFYIRRGFKIWPAFYVLMVVGVLSDLVVRGRFVSAGLLPEIFFVQNYFEGVWGLTWSLAVEEHFYLILPIVLWLMVRFGRHPQRPFASTPYVFGFVAIFCLGCRFAVGWKENETTHYLTYFYPTHLRIDGLMFGVLLSYFYQFRPGLFERIASWRGGWVAIAAAIALPLSLPINNRNMHTWGLTVVYVGAGFLVAKAVAFEGPARIRAVSRRIAWIGVYSYSIYLWHGFYFDRLYGYFHIRPPLLWFWCYFAGSILFGIGAAKVIEIPVLHFRDRVFPRGSKGPLTAATGKSTDERQSLPRGSAPGETEFTRNGMLGGSPVPPPLEVQ